MEVRARGMGTKWGGASRRREALRAPALTVRLALARCPQAALAAAGHAAALAAAVPHALNRSVLCAPHAPGLLAALAA